MKTNLISVELLMNAFRCGNDPSIVVNESAANVLIPPGDRNDERELSSTCLGASNQSSSSAIRRSCFVCTNKLII